VLRSLAPAIEQIRERGYYVISQVIPLAEIVPRDYYELYDLDESFGDRDYVGAGIIGFRTGSAFYERVIVPTCEDCLAGRSLGFSAGERESRSLGGNPRQTVPMRDCAHFRHDQTILNIHLFKAYPDAFVNDVWEHAGFLSPRDHPRQLIWHHRRGGNMAYLARVPYARRAALRGRTFGVTYRVRWWLKMHEKFFRTSTYVLKVRKVARSLARSPA
jgi:hypothetical protein